MDSIQKIHNDLFEHLRTKYPELRFKLRQSNRYNRLDQGYWFLGNDSYVGTSFWEGMDWQNKTPNIMLGVNLYDLQQPRVYLEFVAKDDAEKAAFFSRIAAPLQMTRLKSSGQETNKWTKTYETRNILEAVDLFLTTDKNIIDAFIASRNLVHLFPKMDKNGFQKCLNQIDKIKRSSIKDVSKGKLTIKIPFDQSSIPLKINRFELSNIAQFKSADITLGSRLTCFIGENGCGKTTLLRAILLGFIGVDQNEYLAKDDKLAISLSNMLSIQGNDVGEIEYAERGKISLLFNKEPEASEVTFMWEKNRRPTLVDTGVFWGIDEKGTLKTLVVGFSQNQGLPDRANSRSSKMPNVGDVLPLLANEPDGRGEALHKWLMSLDHDASNKERQGMPSMERKLINRMFEIISDVTGQKLSFSTVNAQKEIIWIDIDGQIIPLRLVSQGFNNVFSWIGYFMKRLSETAPEGTEDPTQLPAICLIDEIDTYLHPLWQQTIVPALLKHFPNTQFIITTHSPIVVSNMKQGKLYKLENGEAIEIPAGYFGKEYGLTLESIMGAPQRNEDVQKELNALFDLIDQEKFEAAQKKLLELSKKYPNEPELSRAETMLALLTE